jgi:hypothetical protein
MPDQKDLSLRAIAKQSQQFDIQHGCIWSDTDTDRRVAGRHAMTGFCAPGMKVCKLAGLVVLRNIVPLWL